MNSALYVHVPFCHSKCVYCDFYSRPSAGENGHEEYAKAVLAELSARAPGLGQQRWSTIYIGGGTPSILGMGALRLLIEGLGLCEGEFTIEANPEDVTDKWLSAVRSLGVNRVSMGVQSFNDSLLAAIGRRHSGRDALEATMRLKDSGINYSIDLIYGLPGLTSAQWEETLDTAARLKPPHLSAYLLSYEPGTRLYARLLAGKVTEAPAETCKEQYDILCRWSRNNGYRHYEVSNFALPGYEARHNSSYWTGQPYLGLGPGAHSFDGLNRSYNPSDLKSYLATVAQGQSPAITEPEDVAEQANDIIITALRTDTGLDIERLRFLPDEMLEQVRKAVREEMSKGFLEIDSGGRVSIPERLWLVSDTVMRNIIIA